MLKKSFNKNVSSNLTQSITQNQDTELDTDSIVYEEFFEDIDYSLGGESFVDESSFSEWRITMNTRDIDELILREKAGKNSNYFTSVVSMGNTEWMDFDDKLSIAKKIETAYEDLWYSIEHTHLWFNNCRIEMVINE